MSSIIYIIDIANIMISVYGIVYIIRYFIKLRKHKYNSDTCDTCGVNYYTLISDTTEASVNRLVDMIRRGCCDSCKKQVDRDNDIDSIFEPIQVSTLKRLVSNFKLSLFTKISKYININKAGILFFFASAFIAFLFIWVSSMKLHFIILLLLKIVQFALNSLGWWILASNLCEYSVNTIK